MWSDGHLGQPWKDQIKLSHFLLATAGRETGVPLPLLPVACVSQIVGTENKSQNLSEQGCKQEFDNIYFVAGLLGKFI